MVILESAAMGLPMVLRDIPAYGDWLVHGKHCFKADSNQAFIDYIRLLAADDRLRRQHSFELLRLAHEHGLNSIGNQYRQLYTALLEGKVYA